MVRGVHKGAGFSLLEMLVALAIVAIAIGSATLALRPDEQRRVNDEAERLALLLEQAREESELGGMPLAWAATATGYEFQRRELTEAGSAWNVVRGDDLLRPRAWPLGLRIEHQEAAGRVVAQGERIRLEADVTLRMELALGPARARVVGDFAGYRVDGYRAEAVQ